MTSNATNRLYGSVPPVHKKQVADLNGGIREVSPHPMNSPTHATARESVTRFFDRQRRERDRQERDRRKRAEGLSRLLQSLSVAQYR
jgi:hypothetical protein